MTMLPCRCFFPLFIFKVYDMSKQILFIFFNNQHNVAVSRCSKYSFLSIGCLYAIIIIITYQKRKKRKERKKENGDVVEYRKTAD